MNPFLVLGLPEGTRDLVLIRRAYAQKVREARPEKDPAGFRAVREAYESLRAWVASSDEAPAATVGASPPVADVLLEFPARGDEEQGDPSSGPDAARPRPDGAAHDGGPTDAGPEHVPARTEAERSPGPPASPRTPDEVLAAVRAGRLREAAEVLDSWHREGRIDEVSVVAQGLARQAGETAEPDVPEFVVWAAGLVAIERPRLARTMADAAWRAADGERRGQLEMGDLDRLARVGSELSEAPAAVRRALARLARHGDSTPADPVQPATRAEDEAAQRFLAQASNTGALRPWVRSVAPGFLKQADRAFAEERREAIRARHATMPAFRTANGRSWSWFLAVVAAVAVVTLLRNLEIGPRGLSRDDLPSFTPPRISRDEQSLREMIEWLEKTQGGRMPAEAEERWKRELDRRWREQQERRTAPPGTEPAPSPTSPSK